MTQKSEKLTGSSKSNVMLLNVIRMHKYIFIATKKYKMKKL